MVMNGLRVGKFEDVASDVVKNDKESYECIICFDGFAVG